MPSELQALIDGASGSLVVNGGYEIDTNEPLTLKDDFTLDLRNAVLTAKPTDRIWSRIIEISHNNVTILGGLIIGERYAHLGPTTWDVGGGGGGIFINGGNNVTINGTVVRDCFADGILVLNGKNIELYGVGCLNNRRQGASIINADTVYVHDCTFYSCGGTPPGDGIDVECDVETQAVRNVLIERCEFYDNEGSGVGVGSPGTYNNIRIRNCVFDMKTQPIWAGGNAAPLGTPWWAFLLNRIYGRLQSYRWWGYPTEWYKA